MKRSRITLLLIAFFCLGQSASAAEPAKLTFDTYSGYFVSNKFEPKAPESFVVITDQKEFDKVFGAAFVMRDKSHRLPKDAFKSLIVVAAIKRGNAAVEYKVDGVTEADGVVEFRYTTTEKKSDTATFACPLIVSIPKGKYTAIQFVENGKPVKKVEIGGNARTNVVVGAIRWDGWFNGNTYESHLAPKQWHSRLPFYASILADDRVEVRSDKQDVMDREIAFASTAGLDYWAFCYYCSKKWGGTDSYNYGLKLYLSSKQKPKIQFCLLLQGTHLGPQAKWPETVQALVRLLQESTYQKVLDGRPLVFMYYVSAMKTWAGSTEAAKQRLDALRTASRKAGLKNPYMVAQVCRTEDGVDAVDTLGFDAISSYSMPGGTGNREYPFRELAKANRDFWNACKATGQPVVPVVNTGWDNRPRRGKPRFADLNGPWFTEPTAVELADHLRSAIEWNRDNPDVAQANAAIIYAWNESDEGGWLVPTLSEGSARLDAVQKVLGSRLPTCCKLR